MSGDQKRGLPLIRHMSENIGFIAVFLVIKTQKFFQAILQVFECECNLK